MIRNSWSLLSSGEGESTTMYQSLVLSIFFFASFHDLSLSRWMRSRNHKQKKTSDGPELVRKELSLSLFSFFSLSHLFLLSLSFFFLCISHSYFKIYLFSLSLLSISLFFFLLSLSFSLLSLFLFSLFNSLHILVSFSTTLFSYHIFFIAKSISLLLPFLFSFSFLTQTFSLSFPPSLFLPLFLLRMTLRRDLTKNENAYKSWSHCQKRRRMRKK